MSHREFLVRIALDVADIPEAQRAQTLAEERARGVELVGSGNLVRIWRVPGGSDSVSVWSAADGDQLDELLGSLPIHPWSTFDVTLLDAHPLEAAAEAGHAG